MGAMKRFLAATFTAVTLIASGTGAASAAQDQQVSVAPEYTGNSAMAVVYSDGTWSGTGDAKESRPALSLSKIYLGYWVLYNGTQEEKDMVEDMIRYSDNEVATMLDTKYPYAIEDITRRFALTATERGESWGETVTSAWDVAKFVSGIQNDPNAWPILDGMETAADTAADGFAQDFGTSTLPGAKGTKFAWSDDGTSATGSVTFGDGWTAAALTWGGPEANTYDVQHGLLGDEVEAPAGDEDAPEETTNPDAPELIIDDITGALDVLRRA